jgi:hypothetical protein
MGWGGPGGLTGVAAVAEGQELQAYLDGWIEQGIFREGKIIWDPQEGCHWVEVSLTYGLSREWSADQFRAYIQGVKDATRHHGREERQ